MSLGKVWKKLFGGKYDFYGDGKQYAEESFEVLQHTQNKTLLYKSYLFTKSSTGELLKVFTDYVLNENYQTKSVSIQKNAGNWTVNEKFTFDFKENVLNYKIVTPENTNEENLPLMKKFYIQTPSVVCSSIFAINKKLDSSARNPVALIKSSNELTYETPLQEITVFASYETREGQTFNINQSNYSYVRCEIFVSDLGEMANEFPVVIQVSKKHALPFLIQFDQQHQARLVEMDLASDIDSTNL